MLGVINKAANDYDGLSNDERLGIKDDLRKMFNGIQLKKSPTLGDKPHLKAGLLKKTASLPSVLRKTIMHLVEDREPILSPGRKYENVKSFYDQLVNKDEIAVRKLRTLLYNDHAVSKVIKNYRGKRNP